MRQRTAITACLVCVFVFTGGLQASLMTDSHALVKGSARYTDTTNLLLDARVEYAVYAPGQFKLSYPTRSPNVETLYVYAYQVFNNLPDHINQDPGGRTYITRFSVGMDGDEKASNRLAIHEAGDVVSNTGSLSSSSVKWSFLSPNLTYGQTSGHISDILYFASPYSPETDTCTLQGFGATLTMMLPSPSNVVPEPVSAFWLTLGFLACRRVRGKGTRRTKKDCRLTLHN